MPILSASAFCENFFLARSRRTFEANLVSRSMTLRDSDVVPLPPALPDNGSFRPNAGFAQLHPAGWRAAEPYRNAGGARLVLNPDPRTAGRTRNPAVNRGAARVSAGTDRA